MRKNLSRREMVKSMAGIAIGAGISVLPFGGSYARSAANAAREQISVKVPPPGPKSLALLSEVKKYVGRSNYAGLYGIGLRDGYGSYIEDMDGNVYIDCLTSASSTVLGYSQDEVAGAYYDAALRIQQTAFIYSPNAETVEFAKRLNEITPGDFPKKVLVGLSGSDSNGGAIEAARKFTGKMGVISFDFAYHGSTGLSQAASGFRSLNEGIYDLNDRNFIKVAFPVTPQDGEKVLKNIESVLSFGKTAAVVVEIIQGDGGTLLTPEGFFPRLRDRKSVV